MELVTRRQRGKAWTRQADNLTIIFIHYETWWQTTKIRNIQYEKTTYLNLTIFRVGKGQHHPSVRPTSFWNGIVYCVSVSTSRCACPHAHLKGNAPECHQICVHVACGRGSVFLWQRCNMLCISGFVDDVIFSYDVSYGGVCYSSSIATMRVHPNTPAARYWLRLVPLDVGRQD